jgi:hypothetical protein
MAQLTKYSTFEELKHSSAAEAKISPKASKKPRAEMEQFLLQLQKKKSKSKAHPSLGK